MTNEVKVKRLSFPNKDVRRLVEELESLKSENASLKQLLRDCPAKELGDFYDGVPTEEQNSWLDARQKAIGESK